MATMVERGSIEARILAECRAAKREMPKVGTEANPTPWDLRHAEIDAMLEEREQCG